MFKAPVFVVVALILSIGTLSAADQSADDLISSLPGIDSADIAFDQYSGYLLADNTTGAYIFYWLVESQNDPENDPVVLWSNGGPGCSGLIGFMTEHGPFRPQSDLTLEVNDYSWNKIANMLYVETPPGVGFSYADDKSAYVVGDKETADYNYNAIQSFLEIYPDFRSNDFYITSESYGGHYMPELALKIVQENAKSDATPINFKGFAVGNPYTSIIDNYYGAVETFWGHQIISKPTYSSWRKNCVLEHSLKDCVEVEVQMYQEFGNLNPYALDYPVCNTALLAQRLKLLKFITPEHLKPYITVDPDQYEPCVDNYATLYLNQKSVQEAIHAKSTIWMECSYTIDYSTASSALPMEPIYRYLIEGGFDLDILVYSGDDDTVCATIGTQEWMWNLGYDLVQDWESWNYDDPDYGEQVGGYLTQWDGISFTTVHGAGHEVPTYKPAAALRMFQSYLNGTF